MELMESIVKIDMEFYYVEQTAANARQLDEFDTIVFGLEYKMIEKNIATGTQEMHEIDE
jgi:hypothetical protein